MSYMDHLPPMVDISRPTSDMFINWGCNTISSCKFTEPYNDLEIYSEYPFNIKANNRVAGFEYDTVTVEC